jgi:hypothetical protein
MFNMNNNQEIENVEAAIADAERRAAWMQDVVAKLKGRNLATTTAEAELSRFRRMSETYKRHRAALEASLMGKRSR